MVDSVVLGVCMTPLGSPVVPEVNTTSCTVSGSLPGRGLRPAFASHAVSVSAAKGCAPLPAARIEWWSAGPRGDYDAEHRAAQRVDGAGRYRYETDFPGRYPGRPLHIHVRVTAPGHRPLVTQLYPRPGQAHIDMDFVLVAD